MSIWINGDGELGSWPLKKVSSPDIELRAGDKVSIALQFVYCTDAVIKVEATDNADTLFEKARAAIIAEIGAIKISDCYVEGHYAEKVESQDE